MTQHNLSFSVNTDGRNALSGSQTEQGSSEISLDDNLPAGYTDKAIAFSHTAMNSMFLLATQNATIQVNGTDEVQRITITGTPTGGTFTVTWNAQTTAAIAFNAIASAVQTAIQALSNVGAGNVTCSGGPLPGTPVDVTFTGALGKTNVAAMTTTDSLTGGSTPASAVTTPTAGVAPDETINLVAGSPLLWSRSQSYFAVPFSADVTTWRYHSATSNRVKGKVLVA